VESDDRRQQPPPVNKATDDAAGPTQEAEVSGNASADREDQPPVGSQRDVVVLTAPWTTRGEVPLQMAYFRHASEQVPREFVRQRSAVHMKFLVEEHKTRRHIEDNRNRRFAIIAATLLVVAAALVVTFAPSDREVFSGWIGLALVIVAAGVIGYQRLVAKGPAFEIRGENVETSSDGKPSRNSRQIDK